MPADDVPGATVPVEYLVTMTTHVPSGTPEQAVDDVRAREAAHSRELAAQGHLLRLWRPPLQPGEWRTLGLFAAAGGDRLAEVLASMPLRVWRTDEITPLTRHPNDPAPAAGAAPPGSPRPAAGGPAAEFLVTFTVAVPPGTPGEAVADARAGEARAAGELAGQGRLLRLWGLPGAGRSLGLYRARDGAELAGILAALPLAPWMTADTTPLAPHPTDPGLLRPPAPAAAP
jgi:muconolactone delta-isomerase